MGNVIFIIFNRINQASQTSFQLSNASSLLNRDGSKSLLIGPFLVLLLLFSIIFSSLAQPNFDMVGFATQNGGTSGGKGGQTVTATTFSQLKTYAESSTPYIIMVQGTITNGSSGGQIRVKSNKSIIGVGSTAFFNGVGIDITSQSNIIIQNLKITLVGVSNSGSFNGGDCIGISGSSKNIWIDHCELYSEDPDKQKDIDKYDGLIDIKGQSGFITISWCYWHDHHKGGLVGAADDDLYNDRLVTMHHNYYNKVKLRVPMYRGATGHFFNNYVKDATKASEIRAGTCVRIEKNYYENFSEFAIYTTADSPGKTERIDNYLSKTQSRAYPANCTANIPYNYSSVLTTNVQDVKNIVIQYSGVGKINTPCTAKTWYKDSDGDGKGDPNSTQSSCTQSSGYVADNTDLCPNDGNKFNPGQCGCGVPESACLDCAGVKNGTAILDNCGICIGGTTGKTACTDFIQGEDFCEAIGIQEDKNTGFVGSGYINFDNEINSSGTWYLNSKIAKTTSIGFRFANAGTANRSMSVSVNGTIQKTLIGAATGSWTTWNTEYLNLNLSAGVNKIVLTSLTADGGPNLDLLAFNDTDLQSGGCTKDCNGIVGGAAFVDNCQTCVGGNTGKTACIQDCNGDWNGTATADNCGACIGGKTVNKPCSGFMEAEIACSVDGILLEDKNTGFSGLGYVNADNEIGAGASWNINSTSAQTATLAFRYANSGTASRDGDLYINGSKVTNLKLPPTGAWTTWEMASVNVTLANGANEITLKATTADGLANIDLISFSDGVSEGMCIVTWNVSGINSELTIHPNPTQNRVFWNIEKEWILLDIQGKELAKGKGKSSDLSDFPNGVYFLKIDQTINKVFKN